AGCSIRGHVFVGQLILVLGCVGERLDDQPHLHAVLKDTALDRIFRADQGEHAWTFWQVDEGLKRWRGETLWREVRNGVAIKLACAADLDFLHCAVAMARWANGHFRKDDCAALPAAISEQTRRRAGLRRNTQIVGVKHLHRTHSLVWNQTPRCLFNPRKPAAKTRAIVCSPSASLPGSVSNCVDHSPSVP